MHRPFRTSPSKASKQRKQQEIKGQKWGVTNLFGKTATDTPRVLNACVGGHDVLGGPKAVKVNFKIA